MSYLAVIGSDSDFKYDWNLHVGDHHVDGGPVVLSLGSGLSISVFFENSSRLRKTSCSHQLVPVR